MEKRRREGMKVKSKIYEIIGGGGTDEERAEGRTGDDAKGEGGG